MNKKNIAVLTGGFSSEHEISVQSGKVILEALDVSRYIGYEIRLISDGWFHYDNGIRKESVDLNDFSINTKGTRISFDCCYNTIHGTPGEDGQVQAILEFLKLPHTSSGFYASAITFNKRDCLSILRPWGISMATSFFHNQGEEYDPNLIIEKVGLPCFVKANRSGSSYGVSKVYKAEDIPAAIENAYKADNEVLIESFLSGTELSVGIYAVDGQIHVLPPTEIVSENDFFDYAAKYEGKAQEITPARIDQSLKDQIQSITITVYKVLKLKGIARVDFIMHNGTPHFVEVNTTPGMSPQSIVPQQIRCKGLTLQQMITDIIEDSIKNHNL
jgi:D-alanine-D-alanine ligase